MLASRLIFIGILSSLLSPCCSAGDLNGTAKDVTTSAPIRSASVYVTMGMAISMTQTTNEAGMYRFSGLPAEGRVLVIGAREGYRFGPLNVAMTQGKVETTLWAIPATHGRPSDSFVAWFIRQTSRFHDKGVGLQAVWTKVSYLGIPHFEMLDVAKRVVGEQPDSWGVSSFSDYSKVDRGTIEAMHREYGDYLKNPKGNFPGVGNNSATNSVAIEVAKTVIRYNDSEESNQRFAASFLNIWGRDARKRLDRAVSLNSIMDQVFHSDWDAVRQARDGKKRYKLKFEGFVGSIHDGDGHSEIIDEVFFNTFGDNLTIAGIYGSDSDKRWFSFQIAPETPRSFAGVEGAGKVIGRNPGEGKWTGTR